MQLPGSAAEASRLVVLAEAASTNDALADLALAPDGGAPDFTVVVTTNQTAGRGRLGRSWIAPPGQTLAASLLLRPRGPGGSAIAVDRWGWLPLIAGAAMAETVRDLLPDRSASVKWPNDVLVGGNKLCGILSELLPGGSGVVVGAGLNLSIPADTLPTPTSTSLTIEGAVLTGEELIDAALAGWIGRVRALYDAFIRSGGNADAGGIRSAVVALCGSIGRSVTVQLPDGELLRGVATGIDRDGRLLIESEPGARGARGAVRAVAAGDVTHLRY